MKDNKSPIKNQDEQKGDAVDFNLPLPPHNIEAEKAVLGAMLQDSGAVSKTFQILKEWCFYKSDHQHIFQAMASLFERNEAIDVLTVGAELKRHNQLDAVGGNYYLTELVARVPSAANVEYHARIVLEEARKRKQIGFLTEMLADRCNGSSDETFLRLCEKLKETHAIGRTGKLKPIPLSEITEENTVKWRWQGYLADYHFTLFTALWKSGKTTLLAYLCKEFAHGGELAGRVEPTKVLLITEESKKLWATRRDKLGLGDHIQIISRPFKGRPTREQWESFVAELLELVKTQHFDLVVFDTISKLWPVRDEKDAVDVASALTPLYQIVESGCSVLLVHHPRKGDGNEGQASRGSGELPAFVDIIIEMRRFVPENREDKRRVLTTYSRFDETPHEVVIELSESGYRKVGTKVDARQTDRLNVLAELLNKELPGKIVEEILKLWPEDSAVPKPGKRTIETDLRHGAELGIWLSAGEGKKGDPFRYRLPDAIPAPKDI